MPIAVTSGQYGSSGRRYPSNPSVFSLVSRNFEGRVADRVFVDPTFDGTRFGVITQFAQVDDVGIALVVQALRQSDGKPLDVSAASELIILIGKPDGVVVEKTAYILTNGLDGYIYAITEDGDLDLADDYSIQGKITIGASVVHTQQQAFQVLDNLVPSVP